MKLLRGLRVLLPSLLIGCGLSVFGFAGAVRAHASLESSTPSPSAILEGSPTEILLDFSEPVTLVDGSVELRNAQLDEIDLPAPTTPLADRVEVRDVPPLDSGMYLVTWRVASQDGHLVEGAFTFRIGAGSTSVSSDDLLEQYSSLDSGPQGVGVLRHTGRALAYLGSAAALGTMALAAAIGMRGVRRVVVVGWWAVLSGTIVQFAAQAVYSAGDSWSAVADLDSWADVVSTRLGQGLVVRLVLLAVLVALIRVAFRRGSSDEASAGLRDSLSESVVSSTWWRSSSALVGTGIILTFSATGHPSASSPAAVASAVDTVHLGAILLWIGGLLGILFGDRNESVVRSYSRTATIVFPIAVVTGVWQAWHLLDDWSDLTSVQWGRALVVKTSFVLIAAAIAMVARWLVLADADSSVRRLVSVEVVAAVAIVVASSVMVVSPPEAVARPAVFSAALAQDDIIANVTVTPGRIGANEIHVTVVTPGGSLAPVSGLDMRLSQPGSDTPTVAVAVDALGPNHFLGSVSILSSGDWNLELLVRVDSARIVRLSTIFPI